MSKYSVELLKESVLAIKQKNQRLAVALVKEALASDKTEKMQDQVVDTLNQTMIDLDKSLNGFSAKQDTASTEDREKAEKYLDSFLDNLDDLFATINTNNDSSKRATAEVLEHMSKTVEDFFKPTVKPADQKKSINEVKKAITTLTSRIEDNDEIFGDPVFGKEMETKLNAMLKSLSGLQDTITEM